MKVATLSTLNSGGAGIGSRRRIQALRHEGIDAKLFSYIVTNPAEHTVQLKPRNWLLRLANNRWKWIYLHRKAILAIQNLPLFNGREIFSNTFYAVSQGQLSKITRQNDIVHLHWVVGLLDYSRIVQTFAFTPVVWTLADMNPFTGGCHYSEGCEGYKAQCKQCPLLGGNSNLAHKIWQQKKDAYRQLPNLQIICPSKWMYERARKSSLFEGKEIHYIPNPFPASEFQPRDRIGARKKLGLPIDALLLLFGADSLTSSRKGGDRLSQVLQLLAAHYSRSEKVELVLFGDGYLDTPFKVHQLGFIKDSETLSLAYSAADAYLLMSREDNAPLTLSEALHCDTPVVTFPVGHSKEILQHEVTGYIAKEDDLEDYTSGIVWAIEHGPKRKTEMRLICRRSAEKFHDNASIINKHIELYRKVIDNARGQ